MELEKRKTESEKKENEIIYSKSIKAGKRIYYLDVKKSRNEDLFLAITESKKRISNFDQEPQITYEKHKIFLYKEDFNKFLEGLEDVINFIKKELGDSFTGEYSVPEKELSESSEEKSDEEPETKKSFFNKFKF